MTTTNVTSSNPVYSNNTIASGNTVNVTDYGSATDNTVAAGGTLYTDTYGDVSNTTVQSGGTLQGGQNGIYSGDTVVSSGGKVISGTLSGGTLTVLPSGQAQNVSAISAGQIQVRGGSTVGTVISGAATIE
ncbi:hypothetical protein ACFFLJ_06245, partial [Acetobacter farinalis]